MTKRRPSLLTICLKVHPRRTLCLALFGHGTFRLVCRRQVKALLEVQADTLESTKRQVEKKQTRTVEERDQEIQEEEQGALPEFNEVRIDRIRCKYC